MENNLISRQIYLKQIQPFIKKNIIKVITGQRRVGKSCIMQECMKSIVEQNKKANIIYINKEDFSFNFISDSETLNDYVKKNLDKKKSNFLFIDEVQDINNFEVALRSFLSKKQCDIFIAGTNAKMLSGDLATYLSGRYVEIPVHPLSYKEFLEFHKKSDSDESLISFLTYGGLPYLVNLNLNNDVVFEYLKNVYSTILLKDVVQREKIRNTDFLETLAYYTAENIGSIFSSNNISKYLKSQKVDIGTQQIINYLKAFCNAHLLNKVRRTDIEGLKQFEIGEKYYFEDLGLRNCITGFDFAKDIGKLLENSICNHFVQHDFKISVGTTDKKK